MQSAEPIKVITIRTAAFPATEEGGAAAIETVSAPAAVEAAAFEKAELTKSDRPELSVGADHHFRRPRHGEQRELCQYIEPVADRLGAAMGASRAAVDAGFVPNDWQVGQTGKVVAPDLTLQSAFRAPFSTSPA